MKNLNKVLSVLLAGAMATSLLGTAIAADADFKDASEINNTEAVSVLSILGVINGQDDGNFNPTGKVTRGEMAKMITVATLGADADVSAFESITTKLTDNTNWAKAYVNYCYSNGIIAGKGNNTFAPTANVTAAEAAKMLLVAIGYNADVQGYTGDKWMINTVRDAQLKGFFKGLSVKSEQELTREEAAQMIYNAVQAKTITKSPEISSTGETVYKYNDGGDALLEKVFKVTTYEEQLKGTVFETTGANKGTYTVSIDDGNAGTNTYTKVTEDFSDLLGQKVKVMFYDKNGDSTFNAKDDEVYGIYPVYDDATTAEFALSAVSKTGDKKIKVDGETYTLDSTSITSWEVAVDGTINTTGSTYVSAAALEDADSYNTARLVDTNNDGKYDLSIVYEMDAQKVTYADAKKVIATKTYQTDENVISEGVAKDDYVSLKWNFEKGMTELTKLEKLSGTATATKSNYAKVDGGAWIYDSGSPAMMSVDNTYDYYVLNGVLVAATQTTAATLDSLVFVSEVDSGTINKNARVYYVDGTSAVVKVDGDDPSDGKLYTISKNDNGYKFTECTNTAADAIFNGYTYTAGASTQVSASSSKIDKIGSVAVADDAVIFVKSGKKMKVITGKQLKTLDAHASNNTTINTTGLGHFTKTVNGLNKVVIAAVTYNEASAGNWTGWSISNAAEHYGLITSDYITVSDGYQYTIWNGTENLTVVDKTSNSIAMANATKFSIVEYSSISSDNEIKDPTFRKMDNSAYSAGANKYAPAALIGYETNSSKGYNLTLNASGTVVTTNEDTVFWTINSSDDEIGVENKADLKLADKIAGVNVQNVIVYTSASGAADLVIFDVTNKLDTAAAQQYAISSITTGLTITDADGNAVTTSSKVKAGDVLTISNNTASPVSTNSSTTGLNTTAGSTLGSNQAIAAGASVVVVVSGAVTV